MEGCYNGFIASRPNANLQVFASDLCGYMYLFNNNQALLSQFASLSLDTGSGNPTSLPSGTLFKDLGLSSQYGNPYYTGDFGYVPYLGTTLYANGACAYEHFLVSALLCPNAPALLHVSDLLAI